MSSLADKADDYPQPIKGHISHKEWEKVPALKDEYDQLLKSGMFWEFHPELTGVWEKDREAFGTYRALHRPFTNAAEEIKADPIKPNYYRRTIKGVEIDAIDIIQAFGLGFCLGNALKYILRAGQKSDNSKEQDLKKAGENISRELGNTI